MRKRPHPKRIRKLMKILGLDVWGNLGPYTLWTDKRRKLCVARRYPRFDPRTPEQLKCRRRFRKALDEWLSLERAERAKWEEALKRARIIMTGNAFYVHCRLTGLWQDYVDLCKATGMQLKLPEGVEVGAPPLGSEEE